jgi:predicted nucleic acid-binding protein
MSYLVDTNVLLRNVDVHHAMHQAARQAIDTLRLNGERMSIVPQNLIEFWNVFTRPVERNGLGKTATRAEVEIGRLKKLFPLHLDTPAVYETWEQLVCSYRIVGINVHDARLVAAMLVHGMTRILTFNIDDFKRYREITAVHPSEVIPSGNDPELTP